MPLRGEEETRLGSGEILKANVLMLSFVYSFLFDRLRALSTMYLMKIVGVGISRVFSGKALDGTSCDDTRVEKTAFAHHSFPGIFKTLICITFSFYSTVYVFLRWAVRLPVAVLFAVFCKHLRQIGSRSSVLFINQVCLKTNRIEN